MFSCVVVVWFFISYWIPAMLSKCYLVLNNNTSFMQLQWRFIHITYTEFWVSRYVVVHIINLWVNRQKCSCAWFKTKFAILKNRRHLLFNFAMLMDGLWNCLVIAVVMILSSVIVNVRIMLFPKIKFTYLSIICSNSLTSYLGWVTHPVDLMWILRDHWCTAMGAKTQPSKFDPYF